MTKKSRWLLPLAAVLLLLASCTRVMPRGNWNKDVYKALCTLIEENGIHSAGYDPDCRPYAVFDFDNTTIFNDITQNLMLYQIENLRFAYPPETAAEDFLNGLEDKDIFLEGLGATTREVGRQLAGDYAILRARQAEGATLEEIHQMPEYLDFRARFIKFYHEVATHYDYGTLCMWMPCTLSDMTYAEARGLIVESNDYWLAQDRCWKETWTSPDSTLTVEVSKGMYYCPEMKNLQRALRDNGIDIYFCSASMELILETMASDPKYGICLDTANVFALRFGGGDTVRPIWKPGYPRPYLDGKTELIRELIAPAHGGKSPILIAGDSVGDYAMLTQFPDLQHGLIIDCGNKGEIRTLVEKAHAEGNKGRYLAQPRDFEGRKYLRNKGEDPK